MAEKRESRDWYDKTIRAIAQRKDLPFYEVVMEKRADDAYLVTGNQKHFPAEPFIVTAREFLAILEQNEK